MLCFAIYSANHAFSRVYKPLLKDLGLTFPQFLVMAALWVEDGQNVGAIGEKLCLESSTLTPLLKRLEALGYVTRNRDPDDERQVRVNLTVDAKKLRKKSLAIPGCLLAASGMTGKDYMALQRNVARLRDALLESAANPP
ncbi:MarR family transcriptional regulator [Rhodoblastus sphagnicola]|uniref:MarR family transcriptional regulator n=2 Tax=Rhodoblastus sphagnicola TaxID=333368 RepID=A0A2S6MXB1_9HYPH|nr:MarR family transcriptional regulator [Rhodoblastus sphagnicola]PPQ27003.1 MarR family transcriptional regulator [Rhodoblastus sphagnicola]